MKRRKQHVNVAIDLGLGKIVLQTRITTILGQCTASRRSRNPFGCFLPIDARHSAEVMWPLPLPPASSQTTSKDRSPLVKEITSSSMKYTHYCRYDAFFKNRRRESGTVQMGQCNSLEDLIVCLRNTTAVIPIIGLALQEKARQPSPPPAISGAPPPRRFDGQPRGQRSCLRTCVRS